MSVFNELVGQDDVITQLKHALYSPGAMTHAWLFTGPPGSGRSNAARAFAAALISGGEEQGDVTARVLKGHHESLTIMSTQKSVIAIDEVRELVTRAQSAPVNSPWRVVIIEDADRMSERTANVLLKAIEEPPPATVWLLCAPSPIDVLTTIRSRCRPVRLRIPSRDAVAQLLIERDHVDPDRAKWAAAVAQNHIGRAKYMALNESADEERRADPRNPGQTDLGRRDDPPGGPHRRRSSGDREVSGRGTQCLGAQRSHGDLGHRIGEVRFRPRRGLRSESSKRSRSAGQSGPATTSSTGSSSS